MVGGGQVASVAKREGDRSIRSLSFVKDLFFDDLRNLNHRLRQDVERGDVERLGRDRASSRFRRCS